MSGAKRSRARLEVIEADDRPTITPQQRDEDFRRDDKGRIYTTQANIALAMRKLGVTVRYDRFAGHELVAGLPGFGPRLDDAAMNRLRLAIDSEFTFRITKDFFYDVVSDRARQNSFHPVVEYLAARTWDKVERISTWLSDYASAENSPYVRAVSRLSLVAAARRVRDPGCKFDEMLVLESAQGTNKSTALRTLAVRDEWFVDDLPLGADTKRLMEATAGRWIVEAGELKGMSKGDVATLKAYLSRQTDQARLSYGRKETIAPRQFVIIGTTNETEGYLKDSTGNRRFWPIRVKAFDLDKLRRDRDQLWAEAAKAEADGESIRLDPALYQHAEVEQDARRADDPMVILLSEHLGDVCGKLRTLDAWKVIGVEPGKATQDQNVRLGAAMRELGWERKQRRFNGGVEWAYVRGSDAEREVPIEVEVEIGFDKQQRVKVRRHA